MQKLSISIPSRPTIGSLPTGRVNAMAIVVPTTDDYVIVFERELFAFALLLAKVLAQAMAVVDDQDESVGVNTNIDNIVANIAGNTLLKQRFQQVLIAYLLRGTPSAAPQYLLEKPWMDFATIIIDSMEHFVMGHEYAHIILGHLSTGKTSAALLGGQKVKEILLSWQQEFEADAMGLQLMLHLPNAGPANWTISFFGASFFFICNEVIERSVSVIQTGTDSNVNFGSHPPASLRRQALRELIIRSVANESLVEEPIQMVKAAESIMEVLWRDVEASLYKLHEDGTQLAPVWGQSGKSSM